MQSMYAKDMTTRDISAHRKSVYGVDASAEMISHMTDRILPIAKEWQNRLLEKKYAVVFMDAVHFHVRQDMQIPLHRITDSASNGSVFPVVTEHFSASSDHAFL